MNAKVIRPKAWKSARHDEMLSGWTTYPRPADSDIRYQLRTLRARSRELAQDSDHARHFIQLAKANMIGESGIQLRTKAPLRGGRPDKRARRVIKAAWDEWGEMGSCDVTGRLSWLRVQLLGVDSAAKDGEIILRCIQGWEENRFGFAVQMIDSEALDIDHNEELPNGNQIVMGVEINEWRRPVAYHLTEESPQPWYSSYSRQKRRRIPADQIIHAYVPEWIWQTRGIPWISTPLGRIKMLDGYEDAAVTAARASASKMAAYTQDPEAPIADNQDTDGKRSASGDLLKDASPGGMEVLPPGVGLEVLDWNWPNADHGTFEKAVLRNIASGLGVNYNTLANDLEGVNYSSLRHGMLSERDMWRLLQRWMVESICTPVYRKWLDTSLMMGALAENGRTLDEGRADAYKQVAWRPRGWQWVDPQKDMDGAERAVKLRTRSISSIIRDRGDDPEEVWAELSEDLSRLEELGIAPEMALQAIEQDEREEDADNDDD